MKKIILSFFLLFSVPVWAGFTEGINHFDNQQYTQAFAEFKPLADKGDAPSQYYIAYMYINGLGVAQDTKTGLEYLNKSVEQEYEKSLSLLAYFYSVGRNITQDKKKAFELYLKAAEQEDDDALLNLGVMHYTGDGAPQDIQKAIEYLQRVDLVSKPIVGRYLADIYMMQNDESLKSKTKDLYLLAASNGDLGSFQSLASIIGSSNPEEAIAYYTYAASQGYAPSQYTLGVLYANGSGVPKDLMIAYAWFTLASDQGLEPAIKAQKELEETLTFSEIDLARKKVGEIRQSVIGKKESPLKDYKLKNIQTPEVQKTTKRRPGRRRRR